MVIKMIAPTAEPTPIPALAPVDRDDEALVPSAGPVVGVALFVFIAIDVLVIVLDGTKVEIPASQYVKRLLGAGAINDSFEGAWQVRPELVPQHFHMSFEPS